MVNLYKKLLLVGRLDNKFTDYLEVSFKDFLVSECKFGVTRVSFNITKKNLWKLRRADNFRGFDLIVILLSDSRPLEYEDDELLTIIKNEFTDTPILGIWPFDFLPPKKVEDFLRIYAPEGDLIRRRITNKLTSEEIVGKIKHILNI